MDDGLTSVPATLPGVVRRCTPLFAVARFSICDGYSRINVAIGDCALACRADAGSVMTTLGHTALSHFAVDLTDATGRAEAAEARVAALEADRG